MAGEFFDPTPDAVTTPSSNLPENDPLREWAAQLQDPEIMAAMAKDPQSAINKMIERGIPPPPPEISRYAEGGIDTLRNPPLPTQVVGGATPAPQIPPGTDPMSPNIPAETGADAWRRAKNIGSGIVDSVKETGSNIAGALPTFDIRGKLMGNLTSSQGTPSKPEPAYSGGGVGSDPDARRLPVPPPTNYFDPEPEVNPSPVAQGQVPLPRENPLRPTEAGAQSKTDQWSQGLQGFSDSLKGVKAPAGPPLNPVGTPSVRSPSSINAPALTNLLSLVGQPAPSPLALTLGRLLATGKA